MTHPVILSDAIFRNVSSIQEAMRVILTPDAGGTTEERWAVETPYLTDLIDRNLKLTDESVVLDFGCGIGRISRELIKRHNCVVVGVDTSPRMRALAVEYVLSDRFFAVAPEALDHFTWDFHSILAVWALQHIWDLKPTLKLLARHTAPNCKLMVINLHKRCLPIEGGKWGDDQKDLDAELEHDWELGPKGKLNGAIVTPLTAELAYWAVHQRK